MKLRNLIPVCLGAIYFAACAPTPVAGNWQALGVSMQGVSIDMNYDFTATTMSSKTVTYQGGSPYVTTGLTGTYTWDSEGDGTHVVTSYATMTLSSPLGDVSVLNTVCVDQGNCEGFQFTLPQADQSNCICKKQELVFKVSGNTMTSVIDSTTVTFTPPTQPQ